MPASGAKAHQQVLGSIFTSFIPQAVPFFPTYLPLLFLLLLLTPSFVLSAEFLHSDEFRFYTGVTAIRVDTCLHHIPGSCASVRVPFPFLRDSAIPAGENNNNNNQVTGHLEADLAHVQLV